MLPHDFTYFGKSQSCQIHATGLGMVFTCFEAAGLGDVMEQGSGADQFAVDADSSGDQAVGQHQRHPAHQAGVSFDVVRHVDFMQ